MSRQTPAPLLSLAAATLAFLTACATPSAGTPPGGQSAPEPPRPQRTVTIIGDTSTDNFWLFGSRDTEQSGFVDAGLVGQNANNLELFPWLAEQVPSLDRADWKIDAAAGTMQVTFRLKPNLVWHDGTPYTAADFKFGWEVAIDPKVAIAARTFPALVSSIDTPDDRTIVINWKSLFKYGGTFQKQDVRHLPRHILESTYREAQTSGDYTRFENHPHFTRQFVGMGPYRLIDYTDGTDWTLEAFDRHALGRPKIDRIRYRIVADQNAALTELLSGTADMAIGGIGPQQAVTLQEQWEKPGRGHVSITPLSSRYVTPSLDPRLREPRLRQALLHAIDREAMHQSLFAGISQVMHMPMSPKEPRFQRADTAATKYPFDLQRANQLLDQLGYVRGSDGLRADLQGQRLVIEYRAQSGSSEQEGVQQVVRDNWRQAGVEVDIQNLTRQVARDTANRGRWAGVSQTGGNVNVHEWEERWHSRNIPTEANRWTGDTESRWSNPQADGLLEEINNVRTTRQREDDAVVEFIRLWTQELPALPLVYNVDIIPYATQLVGPLPRIISGGNGLRNWNVHQWELR